MIGNKNFANLVDKVFSGIKNFTNKIKIEPLEPSSLDKYVTIAKIKSKHKNYVLRALNSLNIDKLHTLTYNSFIKSKKLITKLEQFTNLCELNVYDAQIPASLLKCFPKLYSLTAHSVINLPLEDVSIVFDGVIELDIGVCSNRLIKCFPNVCDLRLTRFFNNDKLDFSALHLEKIYAANVVISSLRTESLIQAIFFNVDFDNPQKIGMFPKIEYLTLHFTTGISNEDFLIKCGRNLNNLHVHLESEGENLNLQRFPNLFHLKISGNQNLKLPLSEHGVNICQLKSLRLDCKVDQLDKVEKLGSLTCLTMRSDLDSEIQHTFIAMCPNLKSFTQNVGFSRFVPANMWSVPELCYRFTYDSSCQSVMILSSVVALHEKNTKEKLPCFSTVIFEGISKAKLDPKIVLKAKAQCLNIYAGLAITPKSFRQKRTGWVRRRDESKI
jgi:hypothetical protein